MRHERSESTREQKIALYESDKQASLKNRPLQVHSSREPVPGIVKNLYLSQLFLAPDTRIRPVFRFTRDFWKMWKMENIRARKRETARYNTAKLKDVSFGELMHLVFTRMPGESCHRRLRSLLLCSCDVFRALTTSLCFLDSMVHA